MGDFSHGPIALYQGKACQTHLSAWIDSHSRYIVEARYYPKENLDILVDSLLRGMTLSVQCNPFIAHLPKLDAQQPDEVTLFSEQGIYVGKGVYYQRERGAHPPLPVTKEKEPIESAYISAYRA